MLMIFVYDIVTTYTIIHMFHLLDSSNSFESSKQIFLRIYGQHIFGIISFATISIETPISREKETK